MQGFEFNTVPRIVNGSGSALQLAEECRRLGIARPLVVTDPGLVAIGLVVLGGDGTFLSVARYIGNLDIPLMGVKFGEVGFLAEAAEEDLFKAAGAILEKDFTTV